MSEQLLTTLATAAPNLVVFVILVIVFLRGQTAAAVRFDTYMRSRDENYDKVVNVNTEVIKENSKMLGAAIQVLEAKS
jgi:hypothetical protein